MIFGRSPEETCKTKKKQLFDPVTTWRQAPQDKWLGRLAGRQGIRRCFSVSDTRVMGKQFAEEVRGMQIQRHGSCCSCSKTLLSPGKYLLRSRKKSCLSPESCCLLLALLSLLAACAGFAFGRFSVAEKQSTTNSKFGVKENFRLLERRIYHMRLLAGR